MEKSRIRDPVINIPDPPHWKEKSKIFNEDFYLPLYIFLYDYRTSFGGRTGTRRPARPWPGHAPTLTAGSDRTTPGLSPPSDRGFPLRRFIKFVFDITSYVKCSVADPFVFGPPGSGSVSFCHQAKIVRKTFIPTALWLLFDLIFLKNDVNVPSKSNNQN